VIRSLRAAGASLACLCGDDVAYAAHGAAFAAAIRTAGVKGLILAGRPRDREAELRGAGVDAFVFAGGDAVAALQELYRRLARSGAGQA
jgi:methylmalonyl-CoA mutase